MAWNSCFGVLGGGAGGGVRGGDGWKVLHFTEGDC